MSALKRRVLDLTDGRYWALYGPRGVVEFNVQDLDEDAYTHVEDRAFVGMHSPRPYEHDQGSCESCPFLEGACYVEMSDSGGEFIACQWENAGFDDEVIWRWLEEYHDEMPAGEAS